MKKIIAYLLDHDLVGGLIFCVTGISIFLGSLYLGVHCAGNALDMNIYHVLGGIGMFISIGIFSTGVA